MSGSNNYLIVQEESFAAHGKFLLTGEYAVLDNVDALAIPLKLDQRLMVVPRSDQIISWTSFNKDGSIWFQDKFSLDHISNVHLENNNLVGSKLLDVLRTALNLSGHENFQTGFDAVTRLDFDYQSGMGTSSTLISLVSQWMGCDPFQLQFKCFGGSGYDIACATASSPIVYNYNDGDPQVVPISYEPDFKDQLYFIYLNKKQDSRKSIAQFDVHKLDEEMRTLLNEMPKKFLETEDDLSKFDEVLEQHEQLVGGLIACG